MTPLDPSVLIFAVPVAVVTVLSLVIPSWRAAWRNPEADR